MSAAAQTALSNTGKMDCYFVEKGVLKEGVKAAVLSDECVLSGRGRRGVFTWAR